MRRCAALLLILFSAASAGEPPAAVQAELARTEATLQQLVEMKAQLSAMQEKLDAMIRSLSEQRGALANAKPAPFAGIVSADSGPDRPDPKPRVVRCAALTKDGNRCSRAAQQGSRYCGQHALSKAK